jgi:serine protease Do
MLYKRWHFFYSVLTYTSWYLSNSLIKLELIVINKVGKDAQFIEKYTMKNSTLWLLCSMPILFWGGITGATSQWRTAHQTDSVREIYISQHVTPPNTYPETAMPNLVQAAQRATPAVVHIKATYEAQGRGLPKVTSPLDQLFREFFGEDVRPYKGRPQQTSGSGVIITADGYIITNNHVIDGADQIEITLDDNRRYSAQLIGQDASTDLALLKVKADGLPHLKFGNSDTLQVGEWVLAVGNPFNLTSTVTKGIVSAKARKIDSTHDKNQMRIEAFIQTDAAVNQGNSGGALVNLHGELVGINTAIATNTGNFTGYSFAIPASIVQKVAADLRQYGMVQRAMLGISIGDMNADIAEQKGLKILSGVYVDEVNKQGAASEAGIKQGDVIVAINGNRVQNASQLQEQLVIYKPGDTIRLTYYRKEKEKEVTVTLKSLDNLKKFQIVRRKDHVEMGGARFESVNEIIQKRLKITGGVYIKTIKEGPWKQAGIPQDFIITTVDREPIGTLEQFVSVLNSGRDKEAILVGGYTRRGIKIYRAVHLDHQ